jgi:hypothetical protein
MFDKPTLFFKKLIFHYNSVPGAAAGLTAPRIIRTQIPALLQTKNNPEFPAVFVKNWKFFSLFYVPKMSAANALTMPSQ